jgi:outer membrane receptor protein involved in Fe transport
MVARHLVLAAALGGLGIAELVDPAPADAQSSTTGAIQGTITDETTGDTLVGVTIVVSSPALLNPQTAISDENGFYKIADLPPGNYLVTFYFAKLTIERSGVVVGINKTTPVFQRLRLTQAAGEIVKITDTAPAIDPTSTTQGITLDTDYLRNVPNPGRTFESALGAAAGSQGDGVGVSFSGSSSLENQYIVDGVNTTGLTFGTVGSPVINDFIQEIEVVTGGYNAEYGRATGGVVNVVTKTGSNEIKGSIFGSIQPGILTAPAVRTPVNASSIDAVTNNGYIADIGFELGGPIIKDKLWYFVGFVPAVVRSDTTRTTKRQTDCRTLLPSGELSACDPRSTVQGGHADGVADIDPATGFFITDTLDEEIRSSKLQTYNMIGKINYAASSRDQLQVTGAALPVFARSPGVFGLESSGTSASALTTDVSVKWTSKLNDNKTEIEGVVGWHRDRVDIDSIDSAMQNVPLQALGFGNLGVWGPGFGGETPATNAGCFDGAGDAYPLLPTNCPMNTRYYFVGGPGSITRDVERRLTAKLVGTQRVKLLGNHEIKAGVDVENNSSDKVRVYSGGAFIENLVRQNTIRVTRWVQLKGRTGSPQANENTDPRFNDNCVTPDPFVVSSTPVDAEFLCDYLGGSPDSPGTQLSGNTFNWSAFLRDSWQILPNLTLNAGVRYEEQRLRYASFLQHTVDALTRRPLGKNAMTLQNMWAPRIGAVYDWTQEGRSKVYASWGRFYESIPMDINDRSFGGEVQYIQDFSSMGGACGTMQDPRIGGKDGIGCLTNPAAMATQEKMLGASGVLIAPGIKPQYLDEIVAGVEYELMDDLKVGLSFQNRVLGRVIEDVSTDGANTYLIANPGEWSSAEERRLEELIASTDSVSLKDRLENELRLFRGIRIFDKPRRDYNALQLTVRQRTKQLYLQGSYTYSRVTGNYPGLISYDNGQIDPNISSQYDLIELLANREGALPLDRPHYVKLDGYYLFDLRKQGALVVGARVRAFSGIPKNALGSHFIYGANESFLLPRGALGRTGFDHGVDLHVEYTREIGQAFEQNLALSVFVDVFNVYNHQGDFRVDQTYAPRVSLAGNIQNANPVSGGDYEDLLWVRQIDNNGTEQADPIGRNQNFRNVTSRYQPAYVRIGARLTF